MSLVNDALKRARSAQPTDPPSRPTLWVGMLVPCVLVLGALLFLLMAWEIYSLNNREKVSETRAREMYPAAQTAPAQPPPVPPASVTPQPAAPPTAEIQSQPEGTPPSAALVAPPPAPAAPPMRLQAIIYHPTRPSVIIDGKSLFVGDRLGEWQVSTIHPESVVLAGSGQTKTLMLNN